MRDSTFQNRDIAQIKTVDLTRDGIAVDETQKLLSMMTTCSAKVSVTILKDSRSEPRSSSRTETQELSKFLFTLKTRQPGEYTQQQRLREMGTFSSAERRIIDNFQHEVLKRFVEECSLGRLQDIRGPQHFAGPAGTLFSLHFDRYELSQNNKYSFETDPGRHNLFLQLTGRKRWILFPPILNAETERHAFYSLEGSPACLCYSNPDNSGRP